MLADLERHHPIGLGKGLWLGEVEPLEEPVTKFAPTIPSSAATSPKRSRSSDASKALLWALAACTPRSQSRPNNRRPCKYFKKGTCNLGSNCPFSHARTPPKKQKRRRSRGGVLGDVTNAGGGHPAPFGPPYLQPYGYGYYAPPPPPPPPRQMQAPSGAATGGDGRRGA